MSRMFGYRVSSFTLRINALSSVSLPVMSSCMFFWHRFWSVAFCVCANLFDILIPLAIFQAPCHSSPCGLSWRTEGRFSASMSTEAFSSHS
jgi:hypothetical protein